MGGKPRATCPPEQILAGHGDAVVALVNRLRALIHAMIDGIEEQGDVRGCRIVLRRRADFAFIVPKADHVRLGFEWGAALPDFTGLLEGDDERVRTLAVRESADLDDRALRMLVSAALFDDDTHGFRSRMSGRRPASRPK